MNQFYRNLNEGTTVHLQISTSLRLFIIELNKQQTVHEEDQENSVSSHQAILCTADEIMQTCRYCCGNIATM